MTDIEHNPYQVPGEDVGATRDSNRLLFKNALKAGIIGPVVLFPVFAFFGAVHGLGGLLGGPEFDGLEGARRGLFFAGFCTVTLFCPLVLAAISICSGFLGSLSFPKHPRLVWLGVGISVAIVEYVYLLSFE